jgi:ABC-2 type transport system permease protein
LIISALPPSLETANVSGLLIAFLPAFLLSGCAFPLDYSFPTPLQWLSYVFPGRYMVTISAAQKGRIIKTCERCATPAC